MIPNVTHPDCRAERASQDRDLLSEARDLDGQIEAAAEVMTMLYPPIVLSGVCVISRPSMN